MNHDQAPQPPVIIPVSLNRFNPPTLEELGQVREALPPHPTVTVTLNPELARFLLFFKRCSEAGKASPGPHFVVKSPHGVKMV